MTSSPTAPELLFDFPPRPPLVVIIDSDTSLRRALDALTRDAAWRLETIASVGALLDQRRTFASGCLVLDASQLGSGDLLLRYWPNDVPFSLRAMKAGGVDVLTEPDRTPLLEAVRVALNRSDESPEGEVELRDMRGRYASLSHREREIMALVVSGLMNKQVGHELGISEVTVKAHRGRMMRKMKAPSLANLVIMAVRLQLTGVSSPHCPPGSH